MMRHSEFKQVKAVQKSSFLKKMRPNYELGI
jgi:hypothetical protein